MPHPFTKKQEASFKCGKWLIDAYIQASPEHQDPSINKSVIVGDMIADLFYTMTRCYQYPKGDIESVKIAALSSLEFDHVEKEEIKMEAPPVVGSYASWGIRGR